MIETYWIVGLSLLAVVVGALVPALVQLRRTLRTTQVFLETTGRRADDALVEVSELARRIHRLADEAERGAGRVRHLLESADEIGKSLARIQHALRTAANVGSALGVAVAAGFRAFGGTDGDGSRDPSPATAGGHDAQAADPVRDEESRQPQEDSR